MAWSIAQAVLDLRTNTSANACIRRSSWLPSTAPAGHTSVEDQT